MGELFIGIVAGLIASIGSVLILSAFRPRLAISKTIAKTPSGERGPSDEVLYHYLVKVVNQSRRACVDMRIWASVVYEQTVPAAQAGETGINRVNETIHLRHQAGMILGYRTPKKDRNALYAHRIRFEEAAVKILEGADQTHYLCLRITSRDGWTGFPRTISREYRLAEDIHEGTFAAGKSMDIKPFTFQAAQAAFKATPTPPAD